MQQHECEASDRNIVLTLTHGHIPSYALWYEADVRRETLDQRLDWWRGFAASEHVVVRTMASSYLSSLAPKDVRDE